MAFATIVCRSRNVARVPSLTPPWPRSGQGRHGERNEGVPIAQRGPTACFETAWPRSGQTPRTAVNRRRLAYFFVLRSTAARISALNASASTCSPSRMSIARRAFPSRLELKSLAGSSSEAPFMKVSLTTSL
jgi:hypothetical protein